MNTRKVRNPKYFGLKLYDGLLMPSKTIYAIFREAVEYQPKCGDIFVSGYPKSGTTWVDYIVWQIMNDAAEMPSIHEMWFKYGPQIDVYGTKNLDMIVGPPPR